MLIDPIEKTSHPVWREGRRALGHIGVIEEKAVRCSCKDVVGQRPVRNFVVDFLRFHVPHVLRVVSAIYGGTHAYELPRLLDDAAYVPALADSGEFSIGRVGPVHDYGGYGPHADVYKRQIKDNGFSCKPEFRAFSGYPIIKSSLDAGNIDVFAMDRSTLAGYMNETVELLQPEVKFGEQGYGVATKKGCDLSAVVDQVICDRLADGWLDQEVKTWGLV